MARWLLLLALCVASAAADHLPCPYCKCVYNTHQQTYKVDGESFTDATCHAWCEKNHPVWRNKHTDEFCYWDSGDNGVASCKMSCHDGTHPADTCSKYSNNETACWYAPMLPCNEKLLGAGLPGECLDCYNCKCNFGMTWEGAKSSSYATPATCTKACEAAHPSNMTVFNAGCTEECHTAFRGCKDGCTQEGKGSRCSSFPIRCTGGTTCTCGFESGIPEIKGCKLSPPQ